VLSPDLGGNHRVVTHLLLPGPAVAVEKTVLEYGEHLYWVVLGACRPSGYRQAIPVNTSHLGEYKPSPMAAAVKGSAGGALRTSRGLLAGWLTAAEPSGS